MPNVFNSGYKTPSPAHTVMFLIKYQSSTFAFAINKQQVWLREYYTFLKLHKEF